MQDRARTARFRDQREKVERLLADHKNACKSGLQDLILIDTKTGYSPGGLLLNEEALRRAFGTGAG